MVGKTISHYEILAKIGEGGRGVVCKAEDLKLHRTVALKFLRPEALDSEEHKTRFLHEAQAAAALNHPRAGQHQELPHFRDIPHTPLKSLSCRLAEFFRAAARFYPAGSGTAQIRRTMAPNSRHLFFAKHMPGAALWVGIRSVD